MLTVSELFLQADDYYTFAKSVYAAATAGDRDAQYYLSEAISYCAAGYRMYFERGSRTRTLDEALQWASTRPATSIDEARLIHERCHRMKEEGGIEQFGTAREWLRRSADAGHPLGQVELAFQLFMDAEYATFGQDDSSQAANLRQTARALVEQAIRSKNPEVIWKIGDMQRAITGDSSTAEREQWVWRLAACQRGFDCSADAQWVKFMCRFDLNCQPYEDGVDLMKRMSGVDFLEIERRAKELYARIDAEAWEEIGFGSSGKAQDQAEHS